MSTWELYIPERQVKQHVQLIGVASEPNVVLMPKLLHLQPTIIGTSFKFNNFTTSKHSYRLLLVFLSLKL